MNVEANSVFECSWEVCNKVGGIYTVISSKARYMLNYYDEYFAVGPYIKEKAKIEFEEVEPDDELKTVFNELYSEHKIKCHFGTWLIEGQPKAILIDFDSLKNHINDLKKYFWDNFKIDSLYSSWDFEEPMLWSYATGLLIDKYQKVTNKKKIVGHFHEWLSAFGMLYLKQIKSIIGSVFTTHATMLGRTLASKGSNIYSAAQINVEQEAKNSGVIDKFSVEKAAALNSDVFTTVSEITAKECEKFFGRYPDVLVLNGFNADEFPTIEETSVLHIKTRELLREYLTYHFFPYYNIDLKHNLMFSTFGRPETKNKGMDIFIRALGKLNKYLSNISSNRTVTVFFWPLQSNNGVKKEILENKNYYEQIKNTIDKNSDEILKDILHDIMVNKEIVLDDALNDKFLLSIKKSRFSLNKKGKPLLCSYEVDEEHNDLINLLKQEGLDNSKDSAVKVVVYPAELNGNDLLLNMNLYDAIAGCHLTVLPSYYEPWGYTPLESAALGVPTITSDLTGFGNFIEKKNKYKKDKKGIYVLKRKNKNENKIIEELFRYMKSFVKLTHSGRVQNKVNAKDLSFNVDWKNLIKNYLEAHNLAINKKVN
jgi:glycogen(starch) synthase